MQHQAANSGPAEAAGASHWSEEAAECCDWPADGVLLATREMARYLTDPYHNDMTITWVESGAGTLKGS